MIATVEQGSGPAVVWVHGYTMDSSIWSPLWSRLPGFHHIGVDLPGHGGSSPMDKNSTLSAVAAELAEVARTWGAASMVALSFGSLIALQVAIEHPEVLDRMVLAAPTLGGGTPDPAARRRYQELQMLWGAIGAGPALVDRWMQAPPDIFRGLQGHPEEYAQVRAACLRHSWDEMRADAMSAITGHDHTDAELAKTCADVLVLSGTADMAAFRSNATRLARTVRRCRVVQMDGAGHLPLLERLDEAAVLIADHLHPQRGQRVSRDAMATKESAL